MKRRGFLQTLLLLPALLRAETKGSAMHIDIQKANERGLADHGWLQSRFTYSFADYINPDRMGFGALRVINDDLIQPGGGFPLHPHRDMEIVTVVTRGAIAHEDTMGHKKLLRAGEVQHMSAGSGIRHSEYNGGGEPLELFQIWIHTNRKGAEPYYKDQAYPENYLENRLAPLVTSDGEEQSLVMRQEGRILRGTFPTEKSFTHRIKREGNGLYLLVVEGSATVGGKLLGRRDGAEISGTETVEIRVGGASDLLAIEVPLE